MALLKIARLGHPVLRRRADPVPDPTAPELRRLACDMVETMLDAVGVGLAAPQVHIGLRLIAFRVPSERQDPGEAATPPGLLVLANPEIEPLGDEWVNGLEGCLSIPGLRGVVPRHAWIRYRGVTLDGTAVEQVASGFHARVVQHEVDHLDGIMFIDRMTDLTTLAFETEVRHLTEAAKDA